MTELTQPANMMGPQDAAAAQIKKIASGDRAALAQLYDRSSPLIFGFVLRVLRDHGIAEEVLLDIYTEVWRKARTFDPSRCSPLVWLLSMARTHAVNRLHGEKREFSRREQAETEAETAKAGAAEPATVEAERQRLVRSALDALSPEQRQVIELAYFWGLSHCEIASRLGQPPGTVRTRIRLGMTRLSDLLGTPVAK